MKPSGSAVQGYDFWALLGAVLDSWVGYELNRG